MFKLSDSVSVKLSHSVSVKLSHYVSVKLSHSVSVKLSHSVAVKFQCHRERLNFERYLKQQCMNGIEFELLGQSEIFDGILLCV